MNNLEERLKQLRKIEVTEQDIQHAKLNITRNTKFRPFHLFPAAITACTFVILCFLVFVPLSNQSERSTSILTDEIEEIHYIVTDRPNINFRADSFNYVLVKKVIKDETVIGDFQQFLQQHLVHPEPYSEKIKGYDVYDIAFKMQNGKVVYLKYNRYSDEGAVFYDTKEKVKYVIPNYEDARPLNDIISKAKLVLSWNLTYIVLFLIVAVFSIGILNYIYLKKYGILDERGKQKRLKGWKHFVPYLIFMMPLYVMLTIVGTIHLGLLIILIHTYLLVNSQLEIKYGVVRKNDIHLKFILPVTSTLAILGLLLILVV